MLLDESLDHGVTARSATVERSGGDAATASARLRARSPVSSPWAPRVTHLGAPPACTI